jgi:hypothetical protein
VPTFEIDPEIRALLTVGRVAASPVVVGPASAPSRARSSALHLARGPTCWATAIGDRRTGGGAAPVPRFRHRPHLHPSVVRSVGPASAPGETLPFGELRGGRLQPVLATFLLPIGLYDAGKSTARSSSAVGLRTRLTRGSARSRTPRGATGARGSSRTVRKSNLRLAPDLGGRRDDVTLDGHFRARGVPGGRAGGSRGVRPKRAGPPSHSREATPGNA